MTTHAISNHRYQQNSVSQRSARPFLKWVGGKQQLLEQYERYFPSRFQRYFEPFVGGGAVFFHLWNTRRLAHPVYLSDKNEELVNAYRVVRDDVEELIELLAKHERHHNPNYYYNLRGLDRPRETRWSDVERAARMIYLNRTCFSGLYRVNRSGQFNVPMGSDTNPKILHEATLRTASAVLQEVCIKTRDFRSLVDVAQAGDFLYFDPPYAPVNKTGSFLRYTRDGFREEDQRRLAEVFAALSGKGCFCMLSNSNKSCILKLYRKFRIKVVQARRFINSVGRGRGVINEVVVLNY